MRIDPKATSSNRRDYNLSRRRNKHLIVLSVIFFGFVFMIAPAIAEDPQMDTSLRKGEARQTIDPSGAPNPKVKAAYQVAKDIPWVLDSIYCYCKCKENPAFRHISLLSCYVAGHASG